MAGPALIPANRISDADSQQILLNENKQVKDRRRLPRHPARLTDAKSFMASFVDGYNHEHRHTGIGFNTPADVHYGLAAAKAIQRAATLETRPGNASPSDSAPTTRPRCLNEVSTKPSSVPAASGRLLRRWLRRGLLVGST